jgi:hypothetical protein
VLSSPPFRVRGCIAILLEGIVGDNDDYAENKIRLVIVITADIALVLVVLNIIAIVGSLS